MAINAILTYEKKALPHNGLYNNASSTFLCSENKMETHEHANHHLVMSTRDLVPQRFLSQTKLLNLCRDSSEKSFII